MVISEPIKPNIIGENLDTGPRKLVKFVPAKDIAKSITANAINRPPIMLINYVLFASTCSAFTVFIFFLLLLLFVMQQM